LALSKAANPVGNINPRISHLDQKITDVRIACFVGPTLALGRLGKAIIPSCGAWTPPDRRGCEPMMEAIAIPRNLTGPDCLQLLGGFGMEK
jgi:hypothetical protein